MNKIYLYFKSNTFFQITILIFLWFIFMEILIRTIFVKVDLLVLTGKKAGENPMKSWAFVDAFCAYKPQPGYYNDGVVKKQVNQYGFISTPDIDINHPSDTIRIAFLGESSTAGTGYNLPDEQTWPYKTQKWLQKNLPQWKFEYINAAVSGYTTFESFGRLWSRVRFFNPDIIVINHGWNEMYYFNEAEKIISWRTLPDGNWTLDSTPDNITTYKPLIIDYLIYWSQVFTRLRLKLSKPLVGEIGAKKLSNLSDSFNQNGLDIFRTNLKLLREVSKVLGIKLFVCKQPTLISENLPEQERKRCLIQLHGFNYQAHLEAFQEIYKIIDQEIPPEDIIDLASKMSGKKELFYDHIHPTEEGTSQYSEIVGAKLKEFLIEKQKAK